MKNKKLKISIFGLGKLGVPFVASFISKGFKVIGVDLDKSKVTNLKKLKSPVYEPGVQKLLNKYGKNLIVTRDGIKAVKETDVTFVIVATPSESSGNFSNKYVLDTCKKIAVGLKEKKSYHIVCVTSTIMPGTMSSLVKPCLENISKKIVTKDFGLCYNPEFIALGSVINDFLNPDFILIGESDPKAGKKIESIYNQVCNNKPKVVRMNFINAELTKLALNTYITTKISFANMLARICEKLKDANVDIITNALGYDSRIGGNYLKGAISYGGPCFPRDNIALTTFAKKIRAPVHIAETTDKFNLWQVKYLKDVIEKFLPESGTIGIIGLTYKLNTNVVEKAFGFLLFKMLKALKKKTIVYDRVGFENLKYALLSKKNFAKSYSECIKKSDVVVITTPDKNLNAIPKSTWSHKNKSRVVIDCWRVLKNFKTLQEINYIPLGIGK
ncbi:MAG: UDP-glucose/GDP-mannose dehydrogenase family protein [Candidatus Melainabacteria bacterium]|nr:UDP-glucose/GDP-mannose dehydrogenase family protein [Candidatus Melainabacteria bacterium]